MGKHHHHQGLTLVELVITLGLLSIVLATGYNFFFTGINIYNHSERRSEVQRGVRMAGDLITNEIRYATELEIIDAGNAASFSNTTYYYIYLDSSDIKIRKPGETSGANIYAGLFDDLSFQLTFSKSAAKLLNFSITGNKAGLSPYTIDSNVSILNISGIGGINSNQAIRFKK